MGMMDKRGQRLGVDPSAYFDANKERILTKLQECLDKSPKGSLDAPICDMIAYINETQNYVTTSSCSGRISVFYNRLKDEDDGKTEQMTKGGIWLLAEHNTVTFEDMKQLVSEENLLQYNRGMILFKHEPFIMHVQCRDLEAARTFLGIAIASGFRESGITIGNKKIMVAARTTANMLELPIARDGKLLITQDYLAVLMETANQKFRENRSRTDKLFACIKEVLGDKQKHELLVHECTRLQVLETPKSLHRHRHSTIVDGKRAIVFGGFGYDVHGKLARLNDVLEMTLFSEETSTLYRPQVQRIDTTMGAPPRPRSHHSATLIGRQMVVFGGRTNPSTALSDLHLLDVDTWEWTQKETLGVAPAARWAHSAVAVDRGLLVYGGRDGEKVFADAFMLQDGHWSRLNLQELPCDGLSRFAHSCHVVHDQAYIFGGLSSLNMHADTLDVLKIELKTWRCEVLTFENDAKLPLFPHSAVLIGATRLLVCGGEGGDIEGKVITEGGRIPYAILDLAKSMIVGNGDLPGAEVMMVNNTLSYFNEAKAVLCIGGGCQVFAFGSTFSPMSIITLSGRQTSETQDVNHRILDPISLPEKTVQKEILYVALVHKSHVKPTKTLLERNNLYDKNRRIRPYEGEDINLFAIPMTSGHLPKDFGEDVKIVPDLVQYNNKCGAGVNPNLTIHRAITKAALPFKISRALLDGLPDSFERVGDILMVPAESFLEKDWGRNALNAVLEAMCVASNTSRIARKAFIDPGLKRRSHVTILHTRFTDLARFSRTRPDAGWVDVRENGLMYSFDITKVMFSSGNNTEKRRMGRMDCQGEVVVDLFAGIGYFVIPFLVHGKASKVHALEWNEDSLDALRHNLKQNKVDNRCIVHPGDNRIVGPTLGPIADRVNLGLLPLSESAWPVAVKVLKASGGWLHIHGNIEQSKRDEWKKHICTTLTNLSLQEGKQWEIEVMHVERVKSYAPKVDHLVADVRCVPRPINLT